MQDEIEALKKRLDELQEEHRGLDQLIAKFNERPSHDQLELQRLKKKKLLLKDQIALLERRLTPDIRA